METPGLNHVILTISDVEQSRAFYGDLLGFEVANVGDDPAWGFYFMAGGVAFFLMPSRQPTPGDRFSEFRVGLDHLAFTATSRESLDTFAEKLIAAGVETQGVEQFEPTGNYYVAFRDPDNIQLEYWLHQEGH
ncbi:MAG TPA: VOC family protein [Ardenticatenaceae bacterium]|jgi:catechol 2,3-dioxygenase-like lactoylglutathione lyase family enzyme